MNGRTTVYNGRRTPAMRLADVNHYNSTVVLQHLCQSKHQIVKSNIH